MSEHQIQRDSVALLREKGYEVISTSSNRRTFSSHRGLPDVLVAVGRGLWCGLEFKAPKGSLSEKQERLMKSGNIHVVRSVPEALAAVLYAERQLQ